MIAAALSRPRLVPLLSILAGALFAAYVALMVTTILFASLQTQLSQEVQDKHMQIAKLETTYYGSVAEIDSADPHALGYVTPKRVEYVTEAQAPGMAFAH